MKSKTINLRCQTLILKDDIHHHNDATCKFLVNFHPEKLHHYLGLPGEFVCNLPTKFIKQDVHEREMDWLIRVKIDDGEIFKEMLVNVEFQAYVVDLNKMLSILDYNNYGTVIHGGWMHSVIVIGEDYDKSLKFLEITPSLILNPQYIVFSYDVIMKKLNNLEYKITNHEKLSDDDAFDMVFISMFAPKKESKIITRKIVVLFSKIDYFPINFREDIAYCLEIMVRKYFKDSDEAKELFKLIKFDVKNSSLDDVIAYELDYRDKVHNAELAEKDAIIAESEVAMSEKDAIIAELRRKLSENGIV